MVNKVILVGRLGKKPVLNYTNGTRKPVTTLDVATDEHTSDGKKTEWHRVVVWERAAENAVQYLDKGKLVYVEGRNSTREYDDNGQTKRVTEVIAYKVQFLSPREGGGREEVPPLDA